MESEITFSPASDTPHGKKPGHWGLPGMRERIEALGGHLYMWSESNAGTEIELRIPADIAYSEPRRSASGLLSRLFRSSE